jgi:uncharacterized protein (TIGR03790 family)
VRTAHRAASGDSLAAPAVRGRVDHPRCALRTLALGAALSLGCLAGAAAQAVPVPPAAGALEITMRPSGLRPEQVAVVVNTADPRSVEIGAYYAERRGIPAANIVRVAFTPGRPVMPREEFARVKAEVDRGTLAAVQAYALTWVQPFRVDCMSVTSAFALGFDEAYCASGCVPTKPSPYFNSLTDSPYDALGLRPTMSLAATRIEDARALVDRGVAADGTRPQGTAYLLDTTDAARNVRAAIFPAMVQYFSPRLRVEHVTADAVQERRDVLFYFTGKADVPGLATNTFLPGAVGDHLTSTGGVLTGSGQMSSLRWLEAGATGSYGTVVEPCNLPGKFPNPAVLLAHYLGGDSLVEAYWKSVRMPGQGIFIGEPLARPFAGVSGRVVSR